MAGSKGPATSNQERSFLWYGQSWSLMNFHIIPFIMFKILSLKYHTDALILNESLELFSEISEYGFMAVSLARQEQEGPCPPMLRPKHGRLIRRPCFRYAGQGPSCPCLFPLPDQIHRVMVRPPVTSYQRSSRCRRTNKELATEPL